MRGFFAILVLTLLAPTAAAEFGRYDANGFPIAVDGTSTYPGHLVPGAALPDGPVNVAGPFTLYPYYPVLTAEVQRLAAQHPDLVHLTSIGKSTLGLDLWMMEIADFENPDMIPLESREVVWVDGGHHSNEYSGVMFAAHLASFLADGYGANETATWIVEHRHTWIMPMVNPDGSHAFGRLNAHGVNVNRNYPVDWGALNEDPLMNNPGPAANSEVETQHNVEWFNKTHPDLYVTVHCCGNLWLYPYGVEGMDPPDQQAFSRMCDEAFPDVREYCGPIWSTIYPASGSSVDTVYEYTGAAAFGYEMSGRGAVALWGQPITSDSIEVQEAESWNGMMHGILNVEKYGAYPTIAAAGVVEGKLTLRVRNDGYGNLTNASLTYTPFDSDPSGPIVDYAPVHKGIPVLLPGEEVTLALDGPVGEGRYDITLEYAKRIMSSPMGARGIALEVKQTATGYSVVGPEGESISALATSDAPVPFVAPALLVALLALIAIRLPRRQ